MWRVTAPVRSGLELLPSCQASARDATRVLTWAPDHARQTAGIRMALPTTERLVWHCGAHTAKPESASWRRFVITKLCCFLWPPRGVRGRGTRCCHAALSTIDRTRNSGQLKLI